LWCAHHRYWRVRTSEPLLQSALALVSALLPATFTDNNVSALRGSGPESKSEAPKSPNKETLVLSELSAVNAIEHIPGDHQNDYDTFSSAENIFTLCFGKHLQHKVPSG
jgi:hypothetical protein